MRPRSIRVGDLDWAEIRKRADEAGETVTAYLLRRALEEDKEAALRGALLQIGSMGYEIMVSAGVALKKKRRSRIQTSAAGQNTK
jgi:hypothetical protein